MSRVVAVSSTVLLLLDQDIAGVAVVGIATRVPKSILHRSLLDTIVYRGCLRPVCRWGMHLGLTVLLCCLISSR